MVDTVKTKELVKKVAELIDEHRGEDTIALYIGDQSSFTDYFIITTVSSNTHLKGIYRDLLNFLQEQGVKPLHKTKGLNEDNWVLIDCGNFVVHLMDREMREFYELERLWYAGEAVYQSSKSS
jgi:ribosome-associated protein